jgi:hypothetical protein
VFFLDSEGQTIIDPDTIIDPNCPSTLVEVPIMLPLPETTNFIHPP